MCRNYLAFLKDHQSCWHVIDGRDRREMAELRKAARRAVSAHLVNQVGRMWRSVVKRCHRHPAGL